MPSKSASTATDSPQATTPPTSAPSGSPKMNGNGVSTTMHEEDEAMAAENLKTEEERTAKLDQDLQEDIEAGHEAVDKKYKALEYLLNQSKLYSTIMLQQMQRQEDAEVAKDEKGRRRAEHRAEKAEKAAEASQRRATRGTGNNKQDLGSDDELAGEATAPAKKGRGRPAKKAKGNAKISDFIKKEDVKAKAGEVSVKDALKEAGDDVKAGEIGMQDLRSARQPGLVTGGDMRKYQLEGLEWLISLYENGLNGILADEMGLGKTIQTISFIAFLREKGTYGPFLIAAPLSTTSNWVAEFKRWTPKIPVVLYHGGKQEREEIRRKQLRFPGNPNFPVVCTSYEMCMNDRKFLGNMGWKFIIIDEGHRIKNLNCRLIRELQSYQSANRLLITGTPLQNNLTELWSLLHFLMPEIFDKLESFESWFDFSALKERNGYEQILSKERQTQLVTSLHAILKPFLLRRVKADVETSLPKKREYILYAPLTAEQRELYQAILDGTSRSFLEDKVFEKLSAPNSGINTPRSTRSVSLKRKVDDTDSRASTPAKSMKMSRDSTPTGRALSRRVKKATNYEEVNDTQYFKELQSAAASKTPSEEASSDNEGAILAANLSAAKKLIASKKLQNPLIQLRLCCNSPHNFYPPTLSSMSATDSLIDALDADIPDETIVTCSGKTMLLDALLPRLFDDNHKVLIFSQFTTQLDLLGSYCKLRGWAYCRIDGSVAQSSRQEQILSFNSNDKDAPNVFLLSTRAGGQGINLAAADTVMLFDSDWNPQQDLQAIDRAHRIGQTRPVIVYRFATKNTVESVMLEKAESKRRLEKLVIRKGGLKATSGRDREGRDELEELQRLLRRDDGERFDVEGTGVLSEEELRILTDRSEEAYGRAEKGLDGSGGLFKTVETVKDSSILEGMGTK